MKKVKKTIVLMVVVAIKFFPKTQGPGKALNSKILYAKVIACGRSRRGWFALTYS